MNFALITLLLWFGFLNVAIWIANEGNVWRLLLTFMVNMVGIGVIVLYVDDLDQKKREHEKELAIIAKGKKKK